MAEHPPAPRATLAGRAAIVTGASRGIGLAVARELAVAGARVAMLARGGHELHERAREIGAGAHPVVCDVTDEQAVTEAVAAVSKHFGEPPDIVVNNAGFFLLAPLGETSRHDFTSSLQVNVIAPFLLVRAVLPAMRARAAGHIVTIGSVADHVAYPENAAYAASKFGVRGLHEVLRAELRGSGVRTTLVSPGPVNTTLWDPVAPDDRPGFTPRAAMLSPDAVAAAVRYALEQPPEVNVEEIRLART